MPRMEPSLQHKGTHLNVESMVVSTFFDEMIEAQSRQNIDCGCSCKASKDQLEMPFVVKLVEVSWLNNGSM